MSSDERTAAMLHHLEHEVLAIMDDAGEPFDGVPRAFAEIGWDSLNVVELQYRLQRTLDRDLPPEVFDVDEFHDLAVGLVALISEDEPWPAALRA